MLMFYYKITLFNLRNSLAVQWLGLSAFTARAQVWSLVKQLRSISHVAKKNPSPKQINMFLLHSAKCCINYFVLTKMCIRPPRCYSPCFTGAGTGSHLLYDLPQSTPGDLLMIRDSDFLFLAVPSLCCSMWASLAVACRLSSCAMRA